VERENVATSALDIHNTMIVIVDSEVRVVAASMGMFTQHHTEDARKT